MMKNKDLFQIGEVAQLFHMQIGTLRYYEKQGLLIPEYVDKQTGYRYYSVRQFEILHTIRYLRALDFPLSEIKDFLINRDVQNIKEKLMNQKQLIEQKKHELDLISKKIDHRLSMLNDATHSRLDQICVVQLPKMRMTWIRNTIAYHSYLDLEHSIRQLEKNQKDSIAFLGKVGVGISQKNLESHHFDHSDFVFILLDEEDEYQGDVEVLPESLYVSVRFCGSRQQSPIYYQKLLDYIQEHHMTINGFSLEMTLIDEGLISHIEQYVTELKIPVII